MQFSEAEIKFLMQPHKIETADRNSPRSLGSAMMDLREIGCPDYIFEKLLEQRARKLGRRFTEFRNSQRQLHAPSAPANDLDSRIEASRLF